MREDRRFSALMIGCMILYLFLTVLVTLTCTNRTWERWSVRIGIAQWQADENGDAELIWLVKED